MAATVDVHFGNEVLGTHELSKPATVVGRDPASDIHIDNLGISRAHCQFLQRGEAYILQDMNSSNGTFVNGRRIGEHYLNDNDEIILGKYVLRFHSGQAAAAPAPADAERIVPDSLNTYVMDGAKIRERMAEMGAPAEAGQPARPEPAAPGEPLRKRLAAAAAASPAAPAPPAVPRRRIVTAEPAGGSIRQLLVFSLLINVVLLVVVLLLVWVLLRYVTARPVTPATSPPPAAAPAVPPAPPAPSVPPAARASPAAPGR